MKLLSPTQTKTANQEQTVKTILRMQELNKATDKARQEFALAEADFNSMLAKNRQRWALEEEEHFKEVNRRTQELATLESRRANALVPVKFLEEAAAAKLAEANQFYAQVKEKEQRLDILADKLEDKLDEAGKKLTDAEHKAVVLDLREQDIERQAATTLAALKDLNKRMAEFTAYQDSENAKLDARKTELILTERSLIAKHDSQQQLDKELAILGIKLKDERESLNAAWAELKTKQLSP